MESTVTGTREVPHELTRGQRIWQGLFEKRSSCKICVGRARLLTESYRKTEGLSIPIRRAMAFENIVANIPINIYGEQLLVGDYASEPMAAEFFPEYDVEWLIKERAENVFPYILDKDDIPALEDACTYWRDKSAMATFPAVDHAFLKNLADAGLGGSDPLEGDKGWNCPDYEKAITKGFNGIIEEIDREIKKTRDAGPSASAKVDFLDGMKIMLWAGILYSKRYAALAREMAKTAGLERKLELEQIARVCDQVPANPARSFHEALQTAFFISVLSFWDTCGHAQALGRIDQYLYPCYKYDLERQRITREDAIGLLECFRVKMCTQRIFRSGYVRTWSTGELFFHNVTIGGQKPGGEDATNELSYLVLEAAFRTPTPHHTISLRWHDKLPEDFAVRALELVRTGVGFPAFFNDNAIIPYLLKIGAGVEEARGYQLSGCVLHTIPHKTPATYPVLMNMAKVLELTLNDGIDPRTGTRFGLQTGNFVDCNSFDELLKNFEKQVEHIFRGVVQRENAMRVYRAEILPQLFQAAFFDDCIQRGKDPHGGGCHYQEFGMYMLPIGVQDSADSLAVIKKLVFEQRFLSKEQLMEALRSNFEGKSDLRKQLVSVPKYGNDDDYTDSIAAGLYDMLVDLCNRVSTPYGTPYKVAPHNLALHGLVGGLLGALPSGRLAGTSIADGAVSPCQGVDINGPTAVIKSAGKIHQDRLLGSLLNMKFSPSVLKTREDLKNLYALIKTYFEMGGKHIQFNVVSRETLLDAQQHPGNYRSLIVRVAGYSAYWVELNKQIQDEIIGRTEHDF